MNRNFSGGNEKGGIFIDRTSKTRLEKMQSVADEILEKVRQRVDLEEPETMNPQALRHITGVLKDLKDIQMLRSEQDRQEQAAKIRNLRRQSAPETHTVTVELTEELEEYCE